MAQVTDRTVGANPTGFDMRTELNNIIAALESDNSGSSEPLNPVAYMKWLDTSNATYYYYKERNHDNTEWVTLFRYTVATKIMEVVSNGVVLQDSALVHKTGDETIAGVKTFSSSPIVPNATTATQSIAYGQAVKNTGDETIAGVKTFSSSPIVPTPTLADNSTKVATTAFVLANAPVTPDATETTKGKVELATNSEVQAGTDTTRAVTPAGLMSAFAQSKSQSGYIKLPGGVIIQWGKTGSVSASATVTVTFPLAFTITTPVVTCNSDYSSTNNNYQAKPEDTTATTVTIRNGNGAADSIHWHAIGY